VDSIIQHLVVCRLQASWNYAIKKKLWKTFVQNRKLNRIGGPNGEGKDRRPQLCRLFNQINYSAVSAVFRDVKKKIVSLTVHGISLVLTILWHHAWNPVATKREPSAWGYNWATLLLGDLNTGTWPSRLGESRIWDSKIWSRVPQESNPWMTVLEKPAAIVHYRPILLSERMLHKNFESMYSAEKKMLIMSLNSDSDWNPEHWCQRRRPFLGNDSVNMFPQQG
jgi:hypothetical protein